MFEFLSSSFARALSDVCSPSNAGLITRRTSDGVAPATPGAGCEGLLVGTV